MKSNKSSVLLNSSLACGHLLVQVDWNRNTRKNWHRRRQAEAQGTIAPEIIASGRQRDVEQLVERIAKNETKLIVIHGQSGVGKSSLVNAGLIPAFQGKQIGIQTVVAVPIRVYTNWVEELGRLFAEKREENGIDNTSTTSLSTRFNSRYLGAVAPK
jgi:DNA replication protein DnaC